MATTKLKIRNDLVKKADGSPTAIYVQYTYQGKPKLFNTGKKIEPQYWDEKAQCVKRSYRGYTVLNEFIKGRKREIDDIVFDAQRRKQEPTLAYVEQQYGLLHTPAPPVVEKDLFTLYDEFIANSKNKRAYNTLKQHRTVLNHLIAFEQHTKYKITLDSINLDFHEKFINYFTDVKKHNPNSISSTIKCLKIFLGDLVEKGINKNLIFQEKRFYQPSAPIEIITLTASEVEQIYQVDLSQHPRLVRVRDLFVLGCSTGLRFSDLVNLKPENIREGEIEFRTIKTKDRLIIPLASYASQIITKYGSKLPKAFTNQVVNLYLKEIGQLAGINTPMQKVKYIGKSRYEYRVPKYELITTHIARRTFITQSLEKGVRPEVLMRVTGHKNITTMMRYVRITDGVVRHEFLRAYGEAAPGVMKVVG